MRPIFKIYTMIFCTVFLAVGCGQKKVDKGEVVAEVNGAAIYEQDVKEDIATRKRLDPKFQVTPENLDALMNTLVNKTILIEEAKKRGLDKDEKFLNAVKIFKEQALLRAVMEEEYAKMDKDISVSPEEVKNLYDNLSVEKTFQVVKSRDQAKISNLVAAGPEAVEWDGTVGPVRYNNITSPMLLEAFGMAKGEMKIFKSGDEYYLLYVKEENKTGIKPFDEVKADIENTIRAAKKQGKFKEWFDNFKKTVKVEINKKELEKAAQ